MDFILLFFIRNISEETVNFLKVFTEIKPILKPILIAIKVSYNNNSAHSESSVFEILNQLNRFWCW